MQIHVTVIQRLPFYTNVNTNQHIVSVTQALGFTETPKHNRHVGAVAQRLRFEDSVKYSMKIANISLTQTLIFTHHAYRNQYVDTHQFLVFTQLVKTNFDPGYGENTLQFTQTVTYELGKAVANILHFVQQVQYEVERALNPTDNLVFTETVNFYLDKVSFYATNETLPNDSAFTVTLTRGPLSVELDSYVFGDIDSRSYIRINRPTRGDQLIVFRDVNWTKVFNFNIAFNDMTEDKSKELATFLKATPGKPITVTDHLGVVCQFIVTNPDFEIVQTGIGAFQISLELYRIFT